MIKPQTSISDTAVKYAERYAPEESIQLPNYEKIINECIHETEIKFERYGNSWLKKDNLFWRERLANEIDEYLKSLTKQAEYRKLLNIVNIATMAIETIDNRGCKYHKVWFDTIVSSKNTVVDTNCIVCKCKVIVDNGIIMVEENES